jgi:hypothetical protein
MTTRAEQVAKELLGDGLIVMRLPMRETLLEFATEAYRRGLADTIKTLESLRDTADNLSKLSALTEAIHEVELLANEEVSVPVPFDRG